MSKLLTNLQIIQFNWVKQYYIGNEWFYISKGHVESIFRKVNQMYTIGWGKKKENLAKWNCSNHLEMKWYVLGPRHMA